MLPSSSGNLLEYYCLPTILYIILNFAYFSNDTFFLYQNGANLFQGVHTLSLQHEYPTLLCYNSKFNLIHSQLLPIPAMQKLIVGEGELEWGEHGGTLWSTQCELGRESPPEDTKKPGDKKTHHNDVISQTGHTLALHLAVFPAENTVVAHYRCWYRHSVWAHPHSWELLENNWKEEKVGWGGKKALRTF